MEIEVHKCLLWSCEVARFAQSAAMSPVAGPSHCTNPPNCVLTSDCQDDPLLAWSCEVALPSRTAVMPPIVAMHHYIKSLDFASNVKYQDGPGVSWSYEIALFAPSAKRLSSLLDVLR